MKISYLALNLMGSIVRFLQGIFLCCCCIPLIAQQDIVTQSTSPAQMKWFQINTDHFRIIFPKDFDEQAERVANMLEHVRTPESMSLGIKPRKISIILHNQSAVSNGFVTQAPWRSEFYTMPSQNYYLTGTNDWLSLLAVHEYRHMVQFEKSRTGFGKIIYYLFGQLLQSGLAFLTVPLWFWEGDAVATETAFTGSGRGRIPRFNLLLRTNLLEGRNIDYDKQYLRSYKQNIPNHYVLGYNMVSFLRKKTGNPSIWSGITKKAWGIPLPFAFSRAIKKTTGLYVKDLYKEMMGDLKTDWLQQQQSITPTPFDPIIKRKSKTYTDYSYPQPLKDGSVVALQSGIGNIATFVTIDSTGRVHKQFVPGLISPTGMLSVEQHKIVWNEYQYDPRWGTRSYFMIKSYDMTTHKKTTICRKSRYATASLSTDGTKIATVESKANYENQLVVLDYESGEAIKRLPNPTNEFISMPRWTQDDKHIVFIALSDGKKSIMRYNIHSGETKTLLAVGDENIGYPVPYGKYVLYNSPVSGIDNIYALDTTTRHQFQVTSSMYGAYNPAISPDGKTIYYNEQTKDGLDVVKTPFDPSTWKPIGQIKEVVPGIYSTLLSEQEGHPDLLKNTPSKHYPIKRYHRIQGIINPHTWGIYLGSSFNTLNFGVLSRDILNTTVIDVGYRYNPINSSGYWNAQLSYQGLYPIIDLDIKYANRSTREAYIQNGSSRTVQFDWNELDISTGLRVPLLTTRSKYISNISVGNAIGIIKTNNFRNSEGGNSRFIPVGNNRAVLFRSYVDNGTLSYNHFSARLSRLLKTSRRDIYSKWGQSLSLNAFNTYPGSNYEGNLLSALLVLYFPGVAAHHSFQLYGAYQYIQIKQQIDNYLFRNQVPTPHGQRIATFQNYYIASANYTLPIAYPDLALGPVLNIQRIWGTVFIDYAWGETASLNVQRAYTSVGGELRFDVNVLRLLPKINLGVRYSYALEASTHNVQFVLGRIGF